MPGVGGPALPRFASTRRKTAPAALPSERAQASVRRSPRPRQSRRQRPRSAGAVRPPSSRSCSSLRSVSSSPWLSFVGLSKVESSARFLPIRQVDVCFLHLPLGFPSAPQYFNPVSVDPIPSQQDLLLCAVSKNPEPNGICWEIGERHDPLSLLKTVRRRRPRRRSPSWRRPRSGSPWLPHPPRAGRA